MRILRKLTRFGRDERGVTILEYGLILAVASIVILALARIMGSDLIDNFDGINNRLVESSDST